MKIAIGNDQGGTELKFALMDYLVSKGFTVINDGIDTTESTDYPLVVGPTCNHVLQGEVDGAILICGTGIGVSIAANKIKGIRAAHVQDPVSASYAKRHNNANVLCLGGRILGVELAKSCVDAWLEAEFEGGRHQRRIDEIADLEK